MFKRLLKRFRRKATPEKWDAEKSRALARLLGTEHDMVMHAIIPYAVGGGLDLYYFAKGISGTGVATKELIDECGEGNSNREHRAYELVMFTRQPLNLDQAKDEQTEFGKMHRVINAVMNLIAVYGVDAKLNPRETCEFPSEMEVVGGRCLIFDSYEPDGRTFDIMGLRFGLLLVMEVHRSELEFARASGTGLLIERLKQTGAYPYSDLDRAAVA